MCIRDSCLCNGDLLLTRYVLCMPLLCGWVVVLYSIYMVAHKPITSLCWVSFWHVCIDFAWESNRFLWQRDTLLWDFHRTFFSVTCTVVCTLPTHTYTMGVSIGHSRDLMTIVQVSYHVTVSEQPRHKLCCFCHFTGCVGSHTITLLFCIRLCVPKNSIQIYAYAMYVYSARCIDGAIPRVLEGPQNGLTHIRRYFRLLARRSPWPSIHRVTVT